MVRKISYQQVINEVLVQEMCCDLSVFIMGEDNVGGVGVFGEDDVWGGVLGVIKGFYYQFFGCVLDILLLEIGYVGVVVGVVICGMCLVCELMFVDFVGCCLDQIFNQVVKFCYMFGGKVVILLVICIMVGVGLCVVVQYLQMFILLWIYIFGFKVVCLLLFYDVKGLLVQVICDNDLVIFCEYKLFYLMQGEVFEELYSVFFGEVNFFCDGDDVILVIYGCMVYLVLDVVVSLVCQGIFCEVLDLCSISLLDEDSIFESVEKIGCLVVVDEVNLCCLMVIDIVVLVVEWVFFVLCVLICWVIVFYMLVFFFDVLEDFYIFDVVKIEVVVCQVLEGRDVV